MTDNTGWKKVVHIADCVCACGDAGCHGECGDDLVCQCGGLYGECGCPGPTEDGVDYEYRAGVLWGRYENEANR